jgi:hypothetical protein
MTDNVPATLTNVSWTCTSTSGTTATNVARCGGTASGAGSPGSRTLGTLNNGQTVTFRVTGTVVAGATGSLVNTASIAAPVSATDNNLANNTVTDTDSLPAAALLAPARVANGVVTAGATTLATGPTRAAGRRVPPRVGASTPPQAAP